MGLNEIQLRSGKIIKPNHSPIITEEEYEPSRGGTVDLEASVTPVTTDREQTVTSITTNPTRVVTPVTTNSGKVDKPVEADSTAITQNPPYPQRLTEPGMTS